MESTFLIEMANIFDQLNSRNVLLFWFFVYDANIFVFPTSYLSIISYILVVLNAEAKAFQ